MVSVLEPSTYLLSYRSQDEEEDKRLESQHDVIKHAILGGNLIHPSIPMSSIQNSIADIACGTGIWLEDVRKSHFADTTQSKDISFVGFDVNAHAFDPTLAPAVKLIQHDCIKEFSAQHLGQFDLVNMRGLAYALPEEDFTRLVANAIKLLRPGGYLQWLETETRLFQQHPTTPEFTEAVNAISTERKSRGLVVYMPHFMLRVLLQQRNQAATNEAALRADPVSILHFNLLPGGICRNLDLRGNHLNKCFSQTILESVKLLLASPMMAPAHTLSTGEKGKIQRLMDAITSIMTSDEILAGGLFPHLVAQKSSP